MAVFDFKKGLLEFGEGIWAYIIITVIIGITMKRF